MELPTRAELVQQQEREATVVHSGDPGKQVMPYLGVPPTGKRVISHVCTLIRLHDGKMVEESVYYDVVERLAQMGSVLALAGRRVTPCCPPR